MSEARIVIRGDASPLERELARARLSLEKFTASAAKSFAGFGAGQIAAAAVGAALGLAARSTLNYADSLNKASQKTGITTEALSALRYGSELSDVSVEQLDTGLRKLAVNMAAAGKGSEESSRAFASIGVDVTTAGGALRATDEVLADIADAFAAMPDGADKAALAVQLFGKSGDSLIPLLNAGRAGLAKFREEAERLGLVVSAETAKSAEEFNDNLTRLGAAARGAGVEIANGMLPYLVKLSEELAGAAKSGGIFQTFGEWLSTGLNVATRAVLLLSQAFKEFGKGLGAVGAIIAAAFTGDFQRIPAILAEFGADLARSRQETLQTMMKFTDDAKTENSKRVENEKETSSKIISIKKAERDQLVAVLSSQVSAYKEAEKELESARKGLLDVQAGNKKFLAELAAGPQKPTEELTSLDISEQLLKAKQLFAAGDLESAADATKRVKENLLAMSRAGTESGLVLQYFGKQAAGLEEQIAQQNFATLEQRLKDIKARIDESLGKAVVIGFDVEASKANLDKLLADLAKQATLPISASLVGGMPKGNLEAATGGLLRGPGTDTSDNLLAWLSPGEYIVRAAAVRHYGTDILQRLNAMNLPRFSAGGAVRSAMAGLGEAPSGSPTIIHLTLPGLGTYPVTAEADIAAALTTVVRREALKAGARR